MTGFIGCVVPRRTTNGPRVSLEACQQFIKRRGCDWSVWQSEDGVAQIAFAGSPITAGSSGARRPFEDAEKGITVCVDGTIDNVLELREMLCIDRSCCPLSQTEIIAMAFRRWGIDGFRRLRGNFAIVLVDTREKKVLLVRDAIGRRPLYSATWNGAQFFGSSVVAMAAVARVRPSFDPIVLKSWWTQEYVSPDRSLLTGCRPIMPGQVLELNWEGVEGFRLSCLPGTDVDVPRTPAQAVERLRELLRRSIEKAFQVSRCPVVFLSGGVDSTVLAEFMWQLGGGRAVSMGGNRWLCPDSPRARFAAHRIGIPLRFVFPPRRDFLETVAWAVEIT